MHSLAKRTVYITDDVFSAVFAHASAPLRDAAAGDSKTALAKEYGVSRATLYAAIKVAV